MPPPSALAPVVDLRARHRAAPSAGASGDGASHSNPSPADLPTDLPTDAPRPQVAGNDFWRASNGTLVELWRPSPDEPELRSWYRPFDDLAIRARTGRYPRVVPADLVTFVGRVDATKWWPPLYVYAGALPHQQLFVASDGQTFTLKVDRSRKLGYRFDRIEVDLAIIRTGLAWYEPPTSRVVVESYADVSYEDDESLPERWRRAPL